MKMFQYKSEDGKALYMEGKTGADLPKVISENLKLQRDKSGYKFFMIPEKPEMRSEEDKAPKKEEEGKEAGKIKGPGKPDGTGPMKDSPECPCSKKKSVAQIIRSFISTLPEE